LDIFLTSDVLKQVRKLHIRASLDNPTVAVDPILAALLCCMPRDRLQKFEADAKLADLNIGLVVKSHTLLESLAVTSDFAPAAAFLENTLRS
jgi:hypothetical protein